MLQVQVVSQHKPDIDYMYTSAVNINQTYLQVHVHNQNKPDISYKYTLSVNINQTYATGTHHQST